MTEVLIDVVTGQRAVINDGLKRAPVTPEMVKAEARRRILAIAPEWQQLNAIRAGETQMFERIDAIRAASDLIEEMQPIPADYRDDKHWTEA